MSRSGLSPEQFRLLQAVAAGEVEPSDPAVAAAAADPRFAEELRLLLAVQGELSAARSELEGLDTASEPFEGADDLVRDEVRRLAEDDGFGDESPRRGFWQWVLAAAALLIVGGTIWFLSIGVEDVPGGGNLSGGEIRCEAPIGTVSDYGTFRWEWELQPDEYFIVTVYTSDRTTELARSDDLDENEWTPQKEFPDAIFWQVRAYDSLGGEVESGEAEARRR